MAEYNVMTIGTSPACVFEMATLKARGLKTLMIDRASTVGGSWGTVELPGLGAVDIGVHFFNQLPGIETFYKDVLGIELTPASPTPKWYLPRRVFGINHTSLYNRWGGGVVPWDNSFPFNRRSWRTAFSPYYRMAFELIKSPKILIKGERYFKVSTVDFSNRIAKFIIEHGLDVRLSTTVERVEINTKRGVVKVITNNSEIEANRFMLTSCAILNSFVLDGEELPISCEPMPLHQLHLVLQGAPVDRLSFGICSHSQNLLFIGNLTTSLKPELTNRGYSLIAACVLPDLPHNDEKVSTIMAELRGYGLLDDRHRLLASHWVQHDAPQRSDEELLEVEKRFSPYISVLPTHSLHFTMKNSLEKWRKELVPS